jgi:hypothetical protein
LALGAVAREEDAASSFAAAEVVIASQLLEGPDTCPVAVELQMSLVVMIFDVAFGWLVVVDDDDDDDDDDVVVLEMIVGKLDNSFLQEVIPAESKMVETHEVAPLIDSELLGTRY